MINDKERLTCTDSGRSALVASALRLSGLSVAIGLVCGSVSVVTGVQHHSLAVFAVGLGVLADVTGSAILIWRFLAERHRSGEYRAAERRAAAVVGAALGLVSVVLISESAVALASGTRPGNSAVTLAAAGISLAILIPLAYAKRRLGRRMGSRALQGDGALSGIGAATSLLALTALALYDTLGWWWADRIAALVVAVIAALEAWRTAPRRLSDDRY